MANSRYAPIPASGRGRGPVTRKGKSTWTVQTARDYLARDSADQPFEKRDSAYHYLLDRVESQQVTKNEWDATRKIFAAALESGELTNRVGVRKRHMVVFAE